MELDNYIHVTLVTVCQCDYPHHGSTCMRTLCTCMCVCVFVCACVRACTYYTVIPLTKQKKKNTFQMKGLVQEGHESVF